MQDELKQTVSNKTSQRSGKTKNEFIKTTKNGPEYSGTTSGTSLRSSRGEFSFTRKKKKNSWSEFQKVKAPQKCCHVTAGPYKQTHHPKPCGKRACPPPPPHVWCPLEKYICIYLEEKCGAAIDRGAARCPPTPPLKIEYQLLQYDKGSFHQSEWLK